MNGLTIGEVAVQAEVHVEMLQYYERQGLADRHTALTSACCP